MTAKWKDYPYNFAPKRELSNKEITDLMSSLFGIKAFGEDFVKSLPEHLQEHFVQREDPNQKPKGTK